MKKSFLLRSCAALVVPMAASAFLPAVAHAQQITTSIQGQVTNEAGEPLAGASVVVTDTRTGATRAITTDAGGLFNAENLSTGGPYTVTATAAGYQGQTVQDINTTLQGPTQLTFALTSASAEVEAGTIVVTASRVRATQLEIGPGTSFTTEVMQNAPSFNRDVRDVIRMDPRVSLDRQDAETGGSGQDRISCLGGNDRGNVFTVDGLAQSDVYGLNETGFSSRSSTPVPYDAVRETQVQFAPMDVEYGNFTGCAINVVSKGGTNRISGSAFYEYSDSSLRGGYVEDIKVADIQPDKRWGVTLGGPILKDRLFVFGAYEKQTAGASQDFGPIGAGFANEAAAVTVPQFEAVRTVLRNTYGIETGDLVTNRPFENERIFGRADWHITDDHRLEATYQRLKESTMRPDDLFVSSAPTITGANNFYLSGTDSTYYSARFYSNWTDNISTELRYSHADIQDLQDPVGGGEAQDDPIVRIVVGIDNPSAANPSLNDATILAGPGFSRSANDLKTKIDLYKAVANFDSGDHRLKLGVEVNHGDLFNLFVQNATGTLVFRSLADLQAGILSNGTSTATPTPSLVLSGGSAGAAIATSRTGDINDAAAEFTRTIYSLMLQDDWRVSDQLNAVFGIRLDMFDGGTPFANPSFFRRYGFANDTGFKQVPPVLLPRLGLTYQPDDFAIFSRFKIQGGVGVFSGGDPLVWIANAFQNNGFLATGASRTSTSNPCGATALDVVDANGNFTGFPDCARNAGIAAAANGLGDTQSIDPNIKQPTVWRANLGIQTDLNFADSGPFSDLRLNLDYIYSHYKDPFTVVDLSQTPDPSRGLSGYAIDGRPIYRSIDPTAAGCTAQLVSVGAPPVWQNVTAPCFLTNRDDELMLTNSDGYDSHIASFILSKNVRRGILTEGGSSYFTLGYAFTAAEDRRNMFNSTATSNYDVTAAFDRQNPAPSRGFYGSRHNITLSGNFREEFLQDLATSLGFTFVARSGRPYSLTFAGTTQFNDDQSGSDNALVYLPTGIDDPNISPTSNMTAVQQLVDFARGLDCAKKYLGRSVPRNSCENDWYYDLDLRFSQEFPGFGRAAGSPYGLRDKFTLFLMVDNFLNMLSRDWNIQRRRDFGARQEIIGIGSGGVDSQGRYIITPLSGSNNTPQERWESDNFINVSSSVWRMKVGVSYEF
ncbi:MAG TPA: TonB-dependent receptor [Sphingomicrobium sp.]|nr:TonB-dependent receptor [Sphingomicrobium sp.]